MSSKIKKSLFIFFVVFFVFFSFSSLCFAQRELEVEYPEILGEKPTAKTILPEYVKYIFNYAIIAAGLVALGALIWAGILYLTSTGDPSKVKEARERIFSAVVGLVILLSSYLILVTVNPELVIFDLPLLTPLISPEVKPPPMVITEGASLIVGEVPLKRMAEELEEEEARKEEGLTLAHLTSDENVKEIKTVITKFENFLNQGVKLNDSSLENDIFTKISDLNKYLKTATDECRSENLRSLCTTPETGSLPIGCIGDPCQTDQDLDIEPNSARGKINKVLAIDRQKIKDLLDFQKKIDDQRDLIREDLRKFQETEGELIACQNQKGELITLNQYLALKQSYEQAGDKVVKIGGYLPSRGDPLTFYCTVGGTVFDEPYDITGEEEIEAWLEEAGAFEGTTFGQAKISCPFKIPVGEVLDQLRELTIDMVFKLQRLSLLTGDLIKQIQEMTELVSQCNETNSSASCACIPNPCYGCCSPIPCTFCVPFCLSPCLQAIGGCSGEACPTEKLEEKSEEIKKTEEKIFETISEIKEIFPQIPYILKDPKNPYNLENISTSVNLCYSSDIYNPTWQLLSCEQARGNYGPSGQIMTNCHPRDFYCCTPTQQTISLPLPIDTSPIYIIPAQKFTPLPTENNCPKGWLCNRDVTYYNQYNNDAAEPLKELLSCMRQKLDRIQGQEELKTPLGQISAISDPKLYQGTCHWTAGPEEPGGCSHIYETKRGKERVSAHYGGTMCRYEQKSYAVDIDITSDLQKKYADEIAKAAKECFPGAYILDKVNHIHIDIGEVYHCRSNE